MTDQVYNVGLGRVAELYKRVDEGDLADLVSGATAEVTNTNYAPKILTEVDLVVWAPDNANDRIDLDIPDQTFTNIAAGDNWSRFVISYDLASSAHVAANTEPLTQHDFIVIPDGSDVTAQINTAGFYRAS